MKHTPNNTTAKHSILNSETPVNIETSVSSRFHKFYDLLNRYYIGNNTNEYDRIRRFIINNGTNEMIVASKTIIQAIEDGYDDELSSNVPVCRLRDDKGKVVAWMYFLPPDVEYEETESWDTEQTKAVSKAVVQLLEDKDGKMDDFTIDVLESAFSIWVLRKVNHESFVEINVDDILEYMGRQKKPSGNKRSDGKKRRGGYKPEQRQAVSKQLRLLASIYCEMEGIEYSDGKGNSRGGKPREVKIKSPLLLIKSETHFTDDHTVKVKIMPGEILLHCFLKKQWALVPLKVLNYTRRQAKEKRLARYLARQWRTNHSKGITKKVYNVQKFVSVMGVDPSAKTFEDNPKRLKEMIDKTLNDIAGADNWEYANWDKSSVGTKDWFKKYVEEAKVILTTPAELVEYYNENIDELPQSKSKSKQVSDLGRKLREARERLGLKPEVAAKQIGIDEITLYRIETGKTKKPVKATRKACEAWLKKIETEQESEE